MIRMNFLYQASTLLHNMDDPSESEPTRTRMRDKRARATSAGDLARNHVQTMWIVGRKTLVKMCVQSDPTSHTKRLAGISSYRDPSVKRTICKGCNEVLIPGITATVRVKSKSELLFIYFDKLNIPASSSHGHAVTFTCVSCATSRRIPAPPTLTMEEGDVAMAMDNDPAEAMQGENEDAPSTKKPVRGRKKRKGPIPRLPPLFDRDVGHVVFCRNEI